MIIRKKFTNKINKLIMERSRSLDDGSSGQEDSSIWYVLLTTSILK